MKWQLIIMAALAAAHEALGRSYLSDEEDSSEHGVTGGSAPTTCPCGWTNKARVVGGRETQANEFPLMLGLVLAEKEAVVCGASILTRRHALTAAHCTHPFRGDHFQVVAGAHDLAKGGDYDDLVDVSQVIDHEEYDPETFANDIALLVLAQSLDFNQYIGPVCMPAQAYQLTNNQIKLLGWGKTKTRGRMSDTLLKVNLNVVPLERCSKVYGQHHSFNLTQPKEICTFRRGKDSCQGDSGGPLIYLDPATNRYTQVALVSFGKECGGDDPAVNTNVFAFTDWIKRNIQDTKLGLTVCEKII